MHEYSLASALLRMAEEHARKHAASRVLRLEIRVGEQSGVEVELLETAWSLVRERSLCESAALAVERVAVRWECPRCGETITPGLVLGCEPCGVPARLAQGGELLLDRIEMEVT